MNKKRNIVLIGMPGSGKSTAGVLFAKAMGMTFMDTDLELMQRTGRRLQDVLDQDGLKSFLQMEQDTVLGLHVVDAVIATGGSVVLEPESMEHLREDGTIVFLDVPLEELRRRITNIRGRGIAFAPGQTLEEVYRERLPLYRRYAECTVEMQPDLEKTVEALCRNLS